MDLPVVDTGEFSPYTTGFGVLPAADSGEYTRQTTGYGVLPTMADSGEFTRAAYGFGVVPSVECGDPILNFTLVPDGGVVTGGGATIAGDPVIPTGGVRAGGAGDVSHVYVTLFTHYPLRGVSLGGAAASSFDWIEYSVSGGIAVAGTAPVTSMLIQLYSIPAPEGGTLIGGEAVVESYTPSGVVLGGAAEAYAVCPLLVVPTGGIELAGVAEAYAVYPLTVIPAGGAELGGAASVAVVTVHYAVGGALLGGAAEVVAKYPVHHPAGGLVLDGEAQAYMVPSTTPYSAENPYYDPYPGWALNADTNGVSRYKGVVANSFCQLDGKTYLANTAGIYEVDGSDDAGQPISARIVLPKDDLESAMKRRIALVWLGAKSSGRLKLGVKTNDDDTAYYTVDLSVVDGVRGSKVKLGKGLEGRYWQFAIENEDGADIDLASFEYEPVVSTIRRGR